MAPTIQVALDKATQKLQAVGIDTARLDAELLLSNILGCKRLELGTLPQDLGEDTAQCFERALARREQHEPVAYIVGKQAFWEHDFIVSPATLIPRQDTETLVEIALKLMPKQGKVLDLGTGTGCVLFSLLHENKDLQGIGVDVSSDALAVAAKNADICGVADRVELLESNWFSAVGPADKQFSAIVANPPYIPSEDIEILMRGVKDHEPSLALDGGTDGLMPYRIIASQAPAYLRDDGLLAVEVGVLQSNVVADLFAREGLLEVTIHKDLPGMERVISGKKDVKS